MSQIYLKDVDIEMLREQRNTLLLIQDLCVFEFEPEAVSNEQYRNIAGLINMLDHMLERAEGYY